MKSSRSKEAKTPPRFFAKQEDLEDMLTVSLYKKVRSDLRKLKNSRTINIRDIAFLSGNNQEVVYKMAKASDEDLVNKNVYGCDEKDGEKKIRDVFRVLHAVINKDESYKKFLKLKIKDVNKEFSKAFLSGRSSFDFKLGKNDVLTAESSTYDLNQQHRRKNKQDIPCLEDAFKYYNKHFKSKKISEKPEPIDLKINLNKDMVNNEGYENNRKTNGSLSQDQITSLLNVLDRNSKTLAQDSDSVKTIINNAK